MFPHVKRSPWKPICSNDVVGPSPPWVLREGGPRYLAHRPPGALRPCGWGHLDPLPGLQLGLLRKMLVSFKMLRLLNGLKKNVVGVPGYLTRYCMQLLVSGL